MCPSLSEFIGKYLGVPNVGDTPGNKGQCVGLIEVWLDLNKRPHIAGNAVDLMANADLGTYAIVKNGPLNVPSPGDIVCWDGTWGGGFGHTAIVVAANTMHLAVFEQNDPDGSPPVVATHGYKGVQGWIVLP